jgi:hypothetical protein
MEVSMDGLRYSLMRSYNSLVTKLNRSVKDASWDSEIVIDPEEIRTNIEELRRCIATLACCYMEGEFKSIEDFELVDFFEKSEDE